MEISSRHLVQIALHRDLAQQLLQRTCQGDLAHDLLQRSSQGSLQNLPKATLNEHHAFTTRSCPASLQPLMILGPFHLSLYCWIAWVGCVPIWKSNKWWNSFLTCPKIISSFSSTHEFCFSLCILSKHMLKGSKARPKSQSWTLPTDTNWIDWDWDEFPGETSYQKRFYVFGM